MSFIVLHKIDKEIDTAKGNEHVEVQVVQVSNNAGAVTNRVEARVFVDNGGGGYTGPTKSALAFTDIDQINELILALKEAGAYLDRLVPGVAAAVSMKAEKGKPAVGKRAPAKAARQLQRA